MFTNDEKLWITTEVRRQQELFLEGVQRDDPAKMAGASIRLEAILAACTKLTTGRAELHRVIFPVFDEGLDTSTKGEPK